MTQYIGIPYLDKGRTFKGCDCYGLVSLYYKHELKIDLPEVTAGGHTPRRSLAEYLEQISKYWVEVSPRKDAVVAMCLNQNHPKMVTHFGVMIDEKTILHSYENTDSHIVKISHPTVKNQIKGFYKWQY